MGRFNPYDGAPLSTGCTMTDLLRVTSPWTTEVVAEYPLDNEGSVAHKVAAAADAARTWRGVELRAREALVRRFLEVAGRDSERVAAMVSSQMGKPIREARGEMDTLARRAEMMLTLASEALADEVIDRSDGIRRTIVREPLGVVLDIAAWNYPLVIAANVVVPAVLAGNAVLLKHASQTPGVGAWFEAAFREAGAPTGLVTWVNLRGRDMAPLLRHPVLGGVYFTGSVPAGRQVNQVVASRDLGFLSTGLELGGKDPAYVRADMPLDVVVPNLVDGAFYNGGQSCCAVERIYVDRSIYTDFVDAYVADSRRWVVGDPSLESTVLGPMATPETLDLMDAQVADAVARGGRLLTGGVRAQGRAWAYPSTVIADATHEMGLMRDESFGPIIGIMPVDGDEEAVALMNDTDFGLTASVWTADDQRGAALARRVLAGTSFVNRCDYVDPSLPWTGFLDTGKGVTLSRLGFEHLTRPRGLHVRPLGLMT